MKKALKIITKILFALALVFMALLLFFRIAFPPAKIKSMIENYVRVEFDREVSFDSISFRIIGVELEGFAVSEKDSFQNGVFAKAEKFSIKVRLVPLLKKEIYVSSLEIAGLSASAVKEKGVYNFDDILRSGKLSEEPQAGSGTQSEKGKFVFAVSGAKIKDSFIKYEDKDKKIVCEFSGFAGDIRNFRAGDPFPLRCRLVFGFNDGTKNILVPLAGSFYVDLAGMDLEKASAEIKSFTAKYNNAQLSVKGTVNNFLNPEIILYAESDILTNDTLKDFLPLKAPFEFRRVGLDLESSFDIKNKTVEIRKADIFSGDSSAKFSGKINYAAAGALYSFDSSLNFNVSEMIGVFGGFKGLCSSSGTVSAKAYVNEKEIVLYAALDDSFFVSKKPEFSVPEIKAESTARIDLLSKSIAVESLNLRFLDSSASVKGVYSYGTQIPSYAFAIDADLNLGSVASAFAKYAAEYDVKGNARSHVEITDKSLSGTAEIKGSEMNYTQLFNFRDLSGRIIMESPVNIKIDQLKGVLNGGKFVLSGSYLKELRHISTAVRLDMDKFYLPAYPEDGGNDTPKKEDAAPQEEEHDIPYTFNITSNIRIGSVELPQVNSKAFVFNSDVKNISSGFDKASGSADFKINKMVIEDMDKLINANKYTNAVFSILGMTYKTTKSAGIEVFDETGNNSEGLKFKSADGKFLFKTGEMEVQKLKLASTRASVSVSGTMSFKTGDLDMRLTLNPLLSKTIVMRIGGTTEKPKVSLNLAASAFTILDTLYQAGSGVVESIKPEKKETE